MPDGLERTDMDTFDDATAITMQTYRQIADIYARTHRNRPPYWYERLQQFADSVRSNSRYAENPSLPVVDMGCGPGWDALFLAQLGFNVLAIDLSEAMLAEAQQTWAGQPGAERITPHRLDMRSLDLPDASCVGIWASASFLHIPKRDNLTVLREFARVLVPGSPLVLSVKECDSGEAERYDTHKESGQVRFFARYNGSELWALLEQAGFRVTSLSSTDDPYLRDELSWLRALATKRP